MSRRIFSLSALSAVLLFAVPAAFARDIMKTGSNRTVCQLENPGNPAIVEKISEEIVRNDHTAEFVWQADSGKLYIIHHNSLGVKQLETIIADLDIPAPVINHEGFEGDSRILLQATKGQYKEGRRICRATKATWGKMLRRYFH